MELIDDKDVETIATLHCQNRSGQIELIHLFAKLVDVEPTKDFTPLSEEHRVQDQCTVVPKAYVDRRSTVHETNIDLNAPPTSENLKSGPHLKIHPVVIETNTDSDDGYDNNSPFDHEVEDYIDPDLDKFIYDIKYESTNDDGNVNVSSVKNPIRDTTILRPGRPTTTGKKNFPLDVLDIRSMQMAFPEYKPLVQVYGTWL
ncbi:hypothetical protein PVK06_041046 [Gossypium arboreum]|uniref:Uncharacterized protein n=1 Tax=Gossypium arboreum TaxID=29729 RepID=A0ABR0N745_GOSAR|nr:hypothetical protein PVK06_041046 [Gossypium arboreum]